MVIQHNKSTLIPGQSERDGDHDARKVRLYVTVANQNTTIQHRLGRTPRHIDCTWKDGFLDWKVSLDPQGVPMVDKDKIVMQFSAARVNAEFRFA